MQFQNFSVKTWSRVAENLIELCFVAFLSFHSCLNNFSVFRNYRDIDFALHCMDLLATNAQISMHWNLMLNFVKIKQRILKRHSSFYWPNVGVGDIEKFKVFNLLASAWDPKIRLELSEPGYRAVTHYAPKILCELLSNISQTDRPIQYIHTEIEVRYKFGSVYIVQIVFIWQGGPFWIVNPFLNR